MAYFKFNSDDSMNGLNVRFNLKSEYNMIMNEALLTESKRPLSKEERKQIFLNNLKTFLITKAIVMFINKPVYRKLHGVALSKFEPNIYNKKFLSFLEETLNDKMEKYNLHKCTAVDLMKHSLFDDIKALWAGVKTDKETRNMTIMMTICELVVRQIISPKIGSKIKKIPKVGMLLSVVSIIPVRMLVTMLGGKLSYGSITKLLCEYNEQVFTMNIDLTAKGFTISSMEIYLKDDNEKIIKFIIGNIPRESYQMSNKETEKAIKELDNDKESLLSMSLRRVQDIKNKQLNFKVDIQQ